MTHWNVFEDVKGAWTKRLSGQKLVIDIVIR